MESSSYSEGLNIVRVCRRYRVGKRIGSGSFGQYVFFSSPINFISILGEVYTARDIVACSKVAIKFEPMDTPSSQLRHEIKIYQELAGLPFIPRIHWFGPESGYYAFVMERLGPSLEDLLHQYNRKLSLKTVLLLGEQLVCASPFLYNHCSLPDISVGISSGASSLS